MIRHKSVILFLSLILCSVIFFACEEVPPQIDFIAPSPDTLQTEKLIDTTYIASTVEMPQARSVMIEEFTGVQCVNCPDGAKKIEEFINNNPDGRIIAVSIHSGGFATPYGGGLSQYDFKIEEGDLLDNMLGPVVAWPAATINRTIYSGETDRVIAKTKWQGYVDQDLLVAPGVNIELTNEWRDSIDQVKIHVKLHFTQTYTTTQKLTLLVIESGMIDAQANNAVPSDIDTFYVHKHVLRDVITDFDGDAISESLEPGRVIEKEWLYTIQDDWVPENCEIIAFVGGAGPEFNILQAAEAHVVE